MCLAPRHVNLSPPPPTHVATPTHVHRDFSAETISILLIEIIVSIYAHKSAHRWLDGLIILMLYPLSLLIVALLEVMP